MLKIGEQMAVQILGGDHGFTKEHPVERWYRDLRATAILHSAYMLRDQSEDIFMNLQNPKKFKMMIDQAHDVAINVLRPISRKYDKAEHAYPKELDMLVSLIDGMNEGGEGINAGCRRRKTSVKLIMKESV